MLGDAYGAAIVEALSKKELEEMDLEMKKQMEREDVESAQTDIKAGKNKVNFKKTRPISTINLYTLGRRRRRR